MTSKVYFVDLRATRPQESLLAKVARLFTAAGFDALFEPQDLVALKIHFGERGNTAYIPPVLVRPIVDEIKKRGGKPFLVDTNTLYVGSRSNAVDHLETALANGFAYAVVNAPLIIADGLTGKDFIEVEVGLKHFTRVKLATTLYWAPSLIALSHVKGHMMTGFGGAIKNLAMGGASRGGKQMMHSSVRPTVKEENCRGCTNCQRWCPAGAIQIVNGKAVVDAAKCYGCGECPVNCRFAAMEIQWEEASEIVEERMAEFAYGLIHEKKGRVGFFNFLLNITPDCDCFSWSDARVVPDLGILASTDPVAIDQASLDLINQAAGLPGTALRQNHEPGGDKFRGIHPEVDPTIQLRYGEKIGLGSRQYELIRVD